MSWVWRLYLLGHFHLGLHVNRLELSHCLHNLHMQAHCKHKASREQMWHLFSPQDASMSQSVLWTDTVRDGSGSSASLHQRRSGCEYPLTAVTKHRQNAHITDAALPSRFHFISIHKSAKRYKFSDYLRQILNQNQPQDGTSQGHRWARRLCTVLCQHRDTLYSITLKWLACSQNKKCFCPLIQRHYFRLTQLRSHSLKVSLLSAVSYYLL